MKKTGLLLFSLLLIVGRSIYPPLEIFQHHNLNLPSQQVKKRKWTVGCEVVAKEGRVKYYVKLPGGTVIGVHRRQMRRSVGMNGDVIVRMD